VIHRRRGGRFIVDNFLIHPFESSSSQPPNAKSPPPQGDERLGPSPSWLVQQQDKDQVQEAAQKALGALRALAGGGKGPGRRLRPHTASGRRFRLLEYRFLTEKISLEGSVRISAPLRRGRVSDPRRPLPRQDASACAFWVTGGLRRAGPRDGQRGRNRSR
jgi:hypothetical protein